MNAGRREIIPPPNPAEIEYKHARLLMNAQEMGYPVVWKGKNEFIHTFNRCDDPNSSGLKTYVHLRGMPNLEIPASEITLVERPQ